MPRTKKEKVVEEPKVVKVPEGAVVVDDRIEFQLRETIVRHNTREAFFIDRPLKPRRGFLIGQMAQSLKLGGRVYVRPEINDSVQSDLESRFGKGYIEDELVVYGGEPAADPEVVGAEDKEEVEDTSSEPRRRL